MYLKVFWSALSESVVEIMKKIISNIDFQCNFYLPILFEVASLTSITASNGTEKYTSVVFGNFI